jgi:hypothetical protein
MSCIPCTVVALTHRHGFRANELEAAAKLYIGKPLCMSLSSPFMLLGESHGHQIGRIIHAYAKDDGIYHFPVIHGQEYTLLRHESSHDINMIKDIDDEEAKNKVRSGQMGALSCSYDGIEVSKYHTGLQKYIPLGSVF